MLGLVHHLGVGGLQNDRVAQLVGRLKRVGDVPDHVARRDRDTAVAEEQRGVLDVQPAAFGVITDEPRGGRLRGREIDVHEPWHRTFRLSPPARVLRGSAHGTYRGFGEVEAGKCRIARRLGSSGPENDERGGDGMSRKRLLRRFCCGGCATDPRFDEYDDQRVQLAASGHDLDGPTQHFGRGCRAQVDRIAVVGTPGCNRAEQLPVCSERLGTVNPADAAASAASTPAPPALPTMPRRSPPGSGWPTSTWAMSRSSGSVSAWSTPAWANSARTAVSELAAAAVCEAPARRPPGDLPALTTSTGVPAHPAG